MCRLRRRCTTYFASLSRFLSGWTWPQSWIPKLISWKDFCSSNRNCTSRNIPEVGGAVPSSHPLNSSIDMRMSWLSKLSLVQVSSSCERISDYFFSLLCVCVCKCNTVNLLKQNLPIAPPPKKKSANNEINTIQLDLLRDHPFIKSWTFREFLLHVLLCHRLWHSSKSPPSLLWRPISYYPSFRAYFILKILYMIYNLFTWIHKTIEISFFFLLSCWNLKIKVKSCLTEEKIIFQKRNSYVYN